MDADDHPDPGLPLLALLQRGVRWCSEELTDRLAAAGVEPITPAHTTVLAHLDDRTPLNVAELARRAGVTRQTMHRAVSQLVEEGLLARTPGAGFPRSTLIELTPAGRHRREVARRVLAELEQILAERLGDTGLANLRTTLERAWP